MQSTNATGYTRMIHMYVYHIPDDCMLSAFIVQKQNEVSQINSFATLL